MLYISNDLQQYDHPANWSFSTGHSVVKVALERQNIKKQKLSKNFKFSTKPEPLQGCKGRPQRYQRIQVQGECPFLGSIT